MFPSTPTVSRGTCYPTIPRSLNCSSPFLVPISALTLAELGGDVADVTLHILFRLAPSGDQLALVRGLFENEKEEGKPDWLRLFPPETPYKSAYRLCLVRAMLSDSPETTERAPFGPLKEREVWAQRFVERGGLLWAMKVLHDLTPRHAKD